MNESQILFHFPYCKLTTLRIFFTCNPVMSWQRLTWIRRFIGLWFWNLQNDRQNPHGLLQVRNTVSLITQNNTICWGLDYLTILFQVELVMSPNKITIWRWLTGGHIQIQQGLQCPFQGTSNNCLDRLWKMLTNHSRITGNVSNIHNTYPSNTSLGALMINNPIQNHLN